MAVHGSENPDKNYITIDIKDEVLVLAKRNIEAAYEKKGHEIDNVALMSQEIALIDNMLGDGDEISRIYINFCNPWPKDRHAKRRLTSETFLPLYEKISKGDVHIIQKTDNKGLFAYSLEMFNNYGYKFNKISLDLTNSDISNVRTEYENKFISLGQTINYADVIKSLPNDK